MDWLDELNAVYFQKEAAIHAEWALEQLLTGELEDAIENQEAAATAWYCFAKEMGLI